MAAAPSPHRHQLLQELDAVRVIDLKNIRSEYKPKFAVRGYATKVFALIHSNFEEVLCLDTDSLPLINPESLFDAPSYQYHGNMFWSDINAHPPGSAIYETFNLTVPWHGDAADTFFAAESGQILLDR